ncbi:hypothetical protein D3C83_248320 [compost metagenome]
MRELTEADLAAAAKTFIRPESVTWIIVGDMAQVASGIRELNLGEIVTLDGDARPVAAAATR